MLLVSNGILIFKLSASVKSASSQLSQGDSDQLQAREKAARSVSITVITVSLMFLCLTLPISIDYVINYLLQNVVKLPLEEVLAQRVMNGIFTLLYYSNSAINFYVYVLTGNRFREEFIKILRCLRSKH